VRRGVKPGDTSALTAVLLRDLRAERSQTYLTEGYRTRAR